MKNGRAKSHHAHRQEYNKIVLGEGKQQQSYQGKAHAHRQGVWSWVFVGIKACEWLQNRGSHLKHQCNDAYLCEGVVEFVLHDRVDGRNDRLNHIIQKMRDAAYNEHRIHRTLHHRRVPLQFTAYSFNIHA